MERTSSTVCCAVCKCIRTKGMEIISFCATNSLALIPIYQCPHTKAHISIFGVHLIAIITTDSHRRGVDRFAVRLQLGAVGLGQRGVVDAVGEGSILAQTFGRILVQSEPLERSFDRVRRTRHCANNKYGR